MGVAVVVTYPAACVPFPLQVVAEAEAVFGADGKQQASRAGADNMVYTLSGEGYRTMWVCVRLLWCLCRRVA